MKIGILSFRSLKRSATAEELAIQRAARKAGHTARIFRSQKFQMVYDQKSPWLIYNGRPFPKYDVIITRPTVLKYASWEIPLIKQLQSMGFLLFNQCDAIMQTKNKIQTMQILDQCDLAIPKTVVVRRKEDLSQAVKLVGGFPLIVKAPFGSYGAGVRIVESMRALKSSILWHQPMYLLQEYVKHSRGKDIRVLVINGQVVGAMMRSAAKGEFRSNIELGGVGTAVEISPEEVHISVRAVQALGLHYGGVDLIRSKKGPMILEVNSNPGFKAFEDCTNIDVASTLVEYAVSFAERHRQKTSA